MEEPINFWTGTTIRGSMLPEPMEVLLTQPLGSALKVVGRGLKTGLNRDVILSAAHLAKLKVAALPTSILQALVVLQVVH